MTRRNKRGRRPTEEAPRDHRDDPIVEQTRHDVAESVARHDRIEKALARIGAGRDGTPGWEARVLAEIASAPPAPPIEIDLIVGTEPESGAEIDVDLLPLGSHDRVDCPCDHPPGEIGPCGGCNCADDPPDGEAISNPPTGRRAPRPHSRVDRSTGSR